MGVLWREQFYIVCLWLVVEHHEICSFLYGLSEWFMTTWKSISKQIASLSIQCQKCRIDLTLKIHPTFLPTSDKHSKLDIFIQLENLITKTSNQNWIYLLNLSIWSHRTSESDDDEKFEKILNLSLVRSSREGKTRGSFKIIIIWVPKIIFWAPLRFHYLGSKDYC